VIEMSHISVYCGPPNEFFAGCIPTVPVTPREIVYFLSFTFSIMIVQRNSDTEIVEK